jgi:hypothetical protein
LSVSSAKFYVKNAETAIKIAEINWLQLYGKEVLKEKPYSIIFRDSVWIVEGTLPKNMLGGVAYIEIRQSDGKILKVMHAK